MMYGYREQLEIVDKIPVKEGQGYNMNCPFCGGRKTFGVALRNGKKLWHCFKVSCGVRGSQDVGMSSTTILKRLNSIEGGPTKKLLPLPNILGEPSNYPAAIKYLEDNNAIKAYEQGLLKVRYSPADNRVLFFSNDEKGAVGRSIVGQIPKWKQYGLIEGLVKVGSGNTAVVVEDIPSACAIAVHTNYMGCALLGTVLSVLQKRQLMTFTNVIIALDKDARKKSLHLQSKLQGRVNTRVVFLEEDLKWLTGEQIQRILP